MSNPNHQPTFSIIGTIFICLCSLFGMFALQLISVYFASLIHYEQSNQLDLNTLITLGSQNGVVVALSVLFTAIIFTLISFLLIYVKIKHKNNVWKSICQFFAIKNITLKGFIISLISLIIFMVISEIITIIADKSPMDFLNGLITNESLLPLIIAIVIIAPIYEELVFRGLIFGSITHLTHANHKPIHLFNNITISKNTLIASLVSSLLFSVVHLQYDFFGMALIFSMALLFAFIRVKYGLIMAILMHMINNGVAMMFYLATSN